jgi:hypothetical protein
MIDIHIKHLFTFLGQLVSDPLAETTCARELPSPWESWTLFSLMLTSQRQAWACRLIEKCIRVREGNGIVPGMPEWEYRFHGEGCCLTNRVTGETIETETGPGYDFYFWLYRLRSNRKHDPVTARMLSLHPSLESLKVTLALLEERGVIRSTAHRRLHRFAVRPVLLQRARKVSRFVELLQGPQADRLTRAMGNPAEYRKERLDFILGLLRGDAEACLQREALYALADLGGDEFPRELRKALHQQPFSGLTSAAIALIAERDDSGWAPAVAGLFEKLQPGGPIPEPHLWSECARFLLRHGHRPKEMRAALLQAGMNSRGEAAILGLEYGAEEPTTLFLRALAADTSPNDRSIAAAALALLDSDWSRGILLTVLRQEEDWEATEECRAGLRESRDPAMHDAADAWENAHRSTYKEPQLNASESVRVEMEELHDRMMAVRRQLADQK